MDSSLYRPSQRLDFLYIKENYAIYVKATVSVWLDINESIPSPPPGDIITVDYDTLIKLRVIGAVSKEGRYYYTFPVLVKIIQSDDTEIDNKQSDDSIIADVRQVIVDHLAAGPSDRYLITTRVHKDGEVKDKVSNHISSDENIELD
jgi:hypothetical protein